MLQAVFFDANGVLIELREDVGTLYGRAAAAQGVDLPGWRLEDAFHRVLRRADSMHAPGLLGDAARAREREWWRGIVRSTFLAADSTVRFPDFDALFGELWDLFASPSAWQVRPDGLALARDARARGQRTGVLSDFDHRLPDLLQTLEIKDAFDHILVPADSGLSKPDPAAFTRAAELAEVPPQRCAYVGHDPELDLAPATAAGFRAIDIGDPEAAATLAAR